MVFEMCTLPFCIGVFTCCCPATLDCCCQITSTASILYYNTHSSSFSSSLFHYNLAAYAWSYQIQLTRTFLVVDSKRECGSDKFVCLQIWASYTYKMEKQNLRSLLVSPYHRTCALVDVVFGWALSFNSLQHGVNSIIHVFIGVRVSSF